MTSYRIEQQNKASNQLEENKDTTLKYKAL